MVDLRCLICKARSFLTCFGTLSMLQPDLWRSVESLTISPHQRWCYHDIRNCEHFQVVGHFSDARLRMRVQSCVTEIQKWMRMNKLKLNADKTEIIMVCSPHIKNNIVYASYRTRKFNPENHRDYDAYTYMISRLDNGIGLFYESTGFLTTFSPDHLMTITKKHDHTTPVLINLHWLPMKQRIECKLLMLMFRSLHGLPASYLPDLLIRHQPAHTLRSADSYRLDVSRSRLCTQDD